MRVKILGVNGDFVRFEIGEEEKFRQFLRTKRAAFLWTDSEDLHVMANMYQMQIKVITTKGPEDSHPTVNMIGPDSELANYKLLPEGTVADMTLLHYDDLHYNLVISKDDDIAKFGTLSQYLTNEESEKMIDERYKDIGNVTVEENTLDDANIKRKMIIEKQNKRIKVLENDLIDKSVELQEAIEIIEHAEEFETVKRKKNEEIKKFNCTKCNSKFKTQVLLVNHLKLSHISVKEFNCIDCGFKGNNDKELRNHLKSLHHQPSQSLLKELKECQASKEIIEKEYLQCEEELRKKTEDLEKLKIEVQDLRTIVDLRKQLQEREKLDMDEAEDEGYEKATLISSSEANSNETNSVPRTEHEYTKESQSPPGRNMKTRYSVGHALKPTETDDEFNCNDCDFQTTSAAHLNKHIGIKHTLNCKICAKEFKVKNDLMKHRKKDHYGSVAPCRKFAENNCPFLENTCFWRHTGKDNLDESMQCFICERTLTSKSELMMHRKKDHPNLVRECNNFQEGKCRFQNEFCWFKHISKASQTDKKVKPIDDEMEIDNEDEAAKSVFYKAQKKPKPPLGGEKQN